MSTRPGRAASATSGGTDSACVMTMSPTGVSASVAWMIVSSAPARCAKRTSASNAARSRLSSVDAASSMMTGASTTSAIGNTTLP
jgi:hypothetical protein